MVLEVRILDSKYYACEECGMIYGDLGTASRCEEWCSSHGSCNVNITREAVGSIRRVGLRMRLR